MAGVPARAVNGYLRRLVRAGHTVGICEQLQDPKQAKGLIDRDVVRLVTAGTLTEDELLDGAKANYLAAVAFDGERAGLSWCELSTGRFVACELPRRALGDELARLQPAELLVAERNANQTDTKEIEAATDAVVTERSDASFVLASARRRLCEAFGVATLEGFGIDDRNLGIAAAGAVYDYLRDTQRSALSHLRRIEPHEPAGYVVLDRATRDALELTENLREGGRGATLLSVVDRARTSMGSRRVREWLLSPLRDAAAIRARQAIVAELHEATPCASVCARPSPRWPTSSGSWGGSASSAAPRRPRPAPPLARPDPNFARGARGPRARARGVGKEAPLSQQYDSLDPCDELRAELARALVEAPPLVATEGGILREGFHAELDELRLLSRDAKSWLSQLEARETERTSIPNLKVGFHRVYGYFLEVTNAHADKVPADYARIQTLKDRERYSTNELREFEAKVRTAETRAIELEKGLFEALRRKVASVAPRVLATARAVGELDALASLAQVAQDQRYVRPEIDDSLDLLIEQGRHPVVEAYASEPFVPNDTRLDAGARLVVLTGPNMAGKSTYLRQVALIVLLAQAGSFVPARRAKVGIVDRISTRIGASDDLARGRSTFLVEMVETAAILNHASERSLVVLDEVGRGTSTFDGMAIAWAVAEHLVARVKARTLFATHYHELNELASHTKRRSQLSGRRQGMGDRVVFLRQVVEGTDRSFGLHVARLAGIPNDVLARARRCCGRSRPNRWHWRRGSSARRRMPTKRARPRSAAARQRRTTRSRARIVAELAARSIPSGSRPSRRSSSWRLRGTRLDGHPNRRPRRAPIGPIRRRRPPTR